MSSPLQHYEPKYVQIANILRRRIDQGDLRPGDPVPSERQIVSDYQVSRPTATRALAMLRAEGLIESRQGLGSTVAAVPPSQGARTRQVVVRRSSKGGGAADRAEILQAELVDAPDDVKAVFGLPDDAQALRRERISFRGSQPVSTSVTWLHPSIAELAPDLASLSDLPDEVVSYVERATGRRQRLYRERVLARLASSEELYMLRLEAPAAVLVGYHTTVDSNGEVLTYEVSVFPADRVRYEDEVLLTTR